MMKISHIQAEKTMLFTAGHDWHLDIFIEANAQIMSVSLKAFSINYPANVYNINYFGVIQNGNQTQLPIDVSKINYSDPSEQVQLIYDITYMS